MHWIIHDITIYTTINLAKIISEFATSSRHGELNLIKAEGTQEEQKFQSLLEKFNDFTDQPSLNLLVTNLLCSRRIYLSNLKSNQENLYINLFATPLENTGLLNTDNINHIFSMMTSTTPLIIKIAIKNLLVELAKKLPDANQQQPLILIVLRLFISKLNEYDLTVSTDLIKEIIETAEVKSRDDHVYIRGLALELFESLAKNNQAFAQATHAAAQGFLHGDNIRYRVALNLFKTLFEKNQAFAQAVEVATSCFARGDITSINRALELFNALFATGHAFEEAIQVAEKSVVNENPHLKIGALHLFIALVENKKAFNKAIQAARDAIKSENSVIKSLGLNLFAVLVKSEAPLRVGEESAVMLAPSAAIKDISDLVKKCRTRFI